MTVKPLAAFAICLALFALFWFDGSTFVVLVMGKVERPEVVLAALILSMGAIAGLLLHIHGTSERAAIAEQAKKHLEELDRDIEHLFLPGDERQGEMALAIHREPARRFAIYRQGFWRAVKLFIAAAILVLIAAGLAAKVLVDIGERLL